MPFTFESSIFHCLSNGFNNPRLAAGKTSRYFFPARQEGPEALSPQSSPIGQLLSSHDTDLVLCGPSGSNCGPTRPKEDYGADAELPGDLFLGVTWVATSIAATEIVRSPENGSVVFNSLVSRRGATWCENQRNKSAARPQCTGTPTRARALTHTGMNAARVWDREPDASDTIRSRVCVRGLCLC